MKLMSTGNKLVSMHIDMWLNEYKTSNQGCMYINSEDVRDLIKKDLEKLGIFARIEIAFPGQYEVIFGTQEDYNLYRLYGSIVEDTAAKHYMTDMTYKFVRDDI